MTKNIELSKDTSFAVMFRVFKKFSIEDYGDITFCFECDENQYDLLLVTLNEKGYLIIDYPDYEKNKIYLLKLEGKTAIIGEFNIN